MRKSTARQFFNQYFAATKGASWLARRCEAQRLKMLEELMQWDVTSRTSDR